MCVHVFVCAHSGVRQGAVAVGLVYVVGGLKVRGEGGGVWVHWGLQSPAPFSHLTNGSGDEGVKVSVCFFFSQCFPLSFFFFHSQIHMLHSGANRRF